MSDREYLKVPVSWPILYRMVSLFEQNKARIVLDRPRSLNGSGREVTNTRRYRQSGGQVSYKPTMLPDEVYKAWKYFTANAQAINKFLFRHGAPSAAKAVFAYMNAKVKARDSLMRTREKRESLFKGRYYKVFVTEIVAKTLEAKLGSRFEACIAYVQGGYFVEVIGHETERAVIHDLAEPLELRTLAEQFIKAA